jgi:hypothetical protein
MVALHKQAPQPVGAASQHPNKLATFLCDKYHVCPDDPRDGRLVLRVRRKRVLERAEVQVALLHGQERKIERRECLGN